MDVQNTCDLITSSASTSPSEYTISRTQTKLFFYEDQRSEKER